MKPSRSARHAARLSPLVAFVVAALLIRPALGQPTSVVSTDGLIKVELKPITPLSSAGFDSGLLSGFPGWTVTKGGSAPGALTTGTYTPRVVYGSNGNAAAGGAILEATYTHPSAPSTPTRFQYTQVASTTGFGTAYATPHLDPLTPDDNLPFYWTAAEAAAHRNATGSEITFYDAPQAPFSGLKNGPVSFTGELYVSEWDGAKDVTVRNGFSWGYDMSLATDGKATGTFSNPSPSCPPATCTGVGTNAFTWGVGINGSGPSTLGFAGGSFTPVIDQPFVIGKLSYFNGTIAPGTEVNSVDFGTDVSFGFGSSFGTPFHLGAKLSLINTPNTSDPIASADFVSFVSGGFNANFHVLEGQSASADLFAKLISSPVDVLAEKQLDDAPFTGFTLAFAGLGNVTGGGFVTTTVPEPSTLILLLTGGALIFAMHRRRTRGTVAEG